MPPLLTYNQLEADIQHLKLEIRRTTRIWLRHGIDLSIKILVVNLETLNVEWQGSFVLRHNITVNYYEQLSLLNSFSWTISWQKYCAPNGSDGFDAINTQKWPIWITKIMVFNICSKFSDIKNKRQNTHVRVLKDTWNMSKTMSIRFLTNFDLLLMYGSKIVNNWKFRAVYPNLIFATFADLQAFEADIQHWRLGIWRTTGIWARHGVDCWPINLRCLLEILRL